MKFSDLLGEPEPDETSADHSAERAGEPAEPDPISVFAPVPMPDRNPPPASVPPLPLPPDLDATIAAVPPVPPIVNPPLDAPPMEPPPVPVVAAPAPQPVPTVAPPTAAPAAPPSPPSAPAPVTGTRSDLASLNVHQPAPAPEIPKSSVMDQLAGLDEVVDDLLPSRRNRR